MEKINIRRASMALLAAITTALSAVAAEPADWYFTTTYDYTGLVVVTFDSAHYWATIKKAQ